MKKTILLLLLFVVSFVYSQDSNTISINWNSNVDYNSGELSFKVPQFDMDFYNIDIPLKKIQFRKIIPVSASSNSANLQITNVVYQNISVLELYDLNKDLIPNSIQASIEVVNAREDYLGVLVLNPIIKEGAIYKKVMSFSYSFQNSVTNRIPNQNVVQSISNSVLTTGDWYRFYVEKSGVYKISKTFLQSLGFNVNVDPRNIKIYGNGGRMLPLNNSIPYPDDLEENAIQFIGEEDGVFDNSDYILFYAEGVDKWNEESLTSVNLFADKSYYYVTSLGVAGKRIEQAQQPVNSATLTFNQFDDIIYYEKDLVNPGKVGRRWFGEQFNIDELQTFEFSIPNLDASVPVQIKVNMASKSFGSSSFNIKANAIDLGTLNFPQLTSGSGIEGYESALNSSFNASSSNISVTLTYNNGGVPSSNGYLDFIKLGVKRNLAGFSKQFLFYNNQEQLNIGVGEYAISNASGISQVWDVTDLYNVTAYENTTGANFSFKVNLGTAKKYVAVDLSDTFAPLRESNAVIVNQNLKGTIFKDVQGNFQDVDYLIITPDFLSTQAERLADFHRNNSGLSVRVVTLEKIYHEFASGKQDVAAIRNFIKYVYWNASASDKRVKYVNLFGDASYDYKNRLFNNSNIVPVFHGFNPLASETNNISNFSLYSSFMSDDFFGLMDDGEGQMLGSFDGIDIAVGRMLVSSVSQANEMVDKVIEYHDEKSYGRWRNNYVIYSDDADNETDATLQFGLDNLANTLTTQKPFVNVKKIHSDSYLQQVAAGGERYPEAKKDFLDALELGALVFNYFGHGNEESLARERLFEKLDAQNLTNRYRYPLF
ncbi:MAG: type IX secretion system sortase PorU, partial [Flavobacterium sp.]|nr:type IX secretion system sortase PorU [Flavobacterium sp.]